ncbi:hypothetical protein VZT92_000758 [Zoarces viviparus]|uniref:Uncharacterized protein n=1 Tax=Zoarces viviparus TaxID=48416 RepID=A0AAW1G7L4_ZOAVI
MELAAPERRDREEERPSLEVRAGRERQAAPQRRGREEERHGLQMRAGRERQAAPEKRGRETQRLAQSQSSMVDDASTSEIASETHFSALVLWPDLMMILTGTTWYLEIAKEKNKRCRRQGIS